MIKLLEFLVGSYAKEIYDYDRQKQPSRSVLRKRYSENIQQIYKRTPMPKCDCVILGRLFLKTASAQRKQFFYKNTDFSFVMLFL